MTPAGTHRESGFTLVELMIVVVIIGILATIAIPKFQDVKGKANRAVLMSDIRNLAAVEEGYLFDHDHYTSVLSDLPITPSPGVIISINLATASGWSASATSIQSYPLTCAEFYGAVAPLAPATVEGIIFCK